MSKFLFVGVLFMFFTILCKAQSSTAASKIPADIEKLLQKHACLACHKADVKLVGPAYLDVSKKKYTEAQIVELIYNPKPSNWPGYPPMTPMKHVPKEDVLKIARWIISLAKRQKMTGH